MAPWSLLKKHIHAKAPNHSGSNPHTIQQQTTVSAYQTGLQQQLGHARLNQEFP